MDHVQEVWNRKRVMVTICPVCKGKKICLNKRLKHFLHRYYLIVYFN